MTGTGRAQRRLGSRSGYDPPGAANSIGRHIMEDDLMRELAQIVMSEYAAYVELSPCKEIEKEYLWVLSDAIERPDPVDHWMRIGVLDDEVRYRTSLFGSDEYFPSLKQPSTIPLTEAALEALANAAFGAGDDTAADISTAHNVLYLERYDAAG